jgi:hypothetical protein
MTANELDRASIQLADISNNIACTSIALEAMNSPWDHGLIEARIIMAIRNMESATKSLNTVLAKKQPILIEAAE